MPRRLPLDRAPLPGQGAKLLEAWGKRFSVPRWRFGLVSYVSQDCRPGKLGDLSLTLRFFAAYTEGTTLGLYLLTIPKVEPLGLTARRCIFRQFRAVHTRRSARRGP